MTNLQIIKKWLNAETFRNLIKKKGVSVGVPLEGLSDDFLKHVYPKLTKDMDLHQVMQIEKDLVKIKEATDIIVTWI